jgi:hypothetical protein
MSNNRTSKQELSEAQLHELADQLLHNDHGAIAESVAVLEFGFTFS